MMRKNLFAERSTTEPSVRMKHVLKYAELYGNEINHPNIRQYIVDHMLDDPFFKDDLSNKNLKKMYHRMYSWLNIVHRHEFQRAIQSKVKAAKKTMIKPKMKSSNNHSRYFMAIRKNAEKLPVESRVRFLKSMLEVEVLCMESQAV